MAQINIPSSGLWSTIATALNSMFTEQYNISGWGNYTDDQYTEGSPLIINAGTTATVANNKATTIDTYLPDDATTFYNGSRITPVNVGDGYDVRFSFKAKSSSTSGAFIASLDISAAGDGSNVIASKAGTFLKGANTEQPFTETISVFSLSTFVANGALLRLESVTGNTSIYDISFYIKRDHRGF